MATVEPVKSGDYLVHVYIEETRALRHPKYDDKTVDPIIEIKSLGKTKYTKGKEKIGTGTTFWGEHIFFEKYLGSAYEVERQMVEIAVKDHSSFGFDSIIGTVSLTLPYIYDKNEKHTLEHQWAALSTLNKKFKEVNGYIKFSIGVFHEDDDQEPLLDDPKQETGDKIMFPPQIDTKPYQMTLTVFRGQNLREMDTWGSCDPFVVLNYGSIKVKTEVVKSEVNPVWNTELMIPLSLPTVSERFTLQLFDLDNGTADEEMGCQVFYVKDILEGKYAKPHWINMYGAPKDSNSKYRKLMTQIPEIATWWQGRIQISLTIDQQEKPLAGARPISNPEFAQQAQSYRTKKFEFIGYFDFAMNLPKNDEKYRIRVRWGDKLEETDKVKTVGRVAPYFTKVVLEAEFPAESIDDPQVPDIFVYINDTDDDISYIRLKPQEISNEDQIPKNYYFGVNLAKSSIRDDLAGIVKMRAYASDPQTRGPLYRFGWDIEPEKYIGSRQNTVHLNIYQAKGLISADDTGLSDPYIKVYFFGQEKKTTICKQTLNPTWNEVLYFEAPFDRPEEGPPLILTFWDHDKYSDDDFIGSLIVPLEPENHNLQELPQPKWGELAHGRKKGSFGKLLFSICTFSDEGQQSPAKTLQIEPPCKKYNINMKILGMRKLRSNGVLPVKRAFIKFDMNSIKRKQDQSILKEKKYISTEPNMPGPNPNIKTVINMDIYLPSQIEYVPSLSCAVFDYILRGFTQPMIGTFSVPLGDYILRTKRKMAKKIKLKKASLNLAEDDPLPSYSKNRETEIVIEPTREKDEETKDDFDPSELRRGAKNAQYKPSSPDDIELSDFVITMKKKGIYNPDPDTTKYIELGYDSNKDPKIKKHFRHFIEGPLEESKYLDDPPFVNIPIHRGSSLGTDSIFGNFFKKKEEVEQNQEVGYFKAMIEVMSEEDKLVWEDQLGDDVRDIKDRQFLDRNEVIVRLYVIKCEGLNSKDETSNSDPYLKIKFGNQVINQRKNYQLDEPNPKFNECFEFSATVPGAPMLSIQVWDHDDFLSDDLIGKTKIDIENRYASTSWNKLIHKPIETRNLYHKSSKMSQGKIKLWLDIIPKEKQLPDPWYLKPKPPIDFELRVVVWDAQEVPRVDTLEDAVDLYITGKLDNGTQFQTDTHFRSTNGKASFNWRMVFPITIPQTTKNRITFQMWDKDLLSKNDYISEVTFDFSQWAKTAFDEERAIKIKQNSDDKFWLQCIKIKQKNNTDYADKLGQLRVSMELVPKTEAKLQPVGQGRSEPNQMPYLPPPVGRFKFSWNPLDMLAQCFGPIAKKKFLMICGAITCIIICIVMFPSLIANIIVG